jgi:hypothetical protein
MLGLASGITNTSYQWQPNMVGGDLKLWLRNNVGVAVAQWDDSSGNGNHVTQGTSGDQAAVSGGGLNFDSSQGDHYDLTSGIVCASEEAFMVFIVINPDAIDNRTLLGIGGTTEFLEIQTNKKLRIKIDGDTDVTEFGSIQFPTGSKYVIGLQRESGGTGNFNVYKNGTLLTPVSQEANTGAITFSTLGTRNTDRYFDGHIYELLVYDTTDLTTSEISKINNYLINKHYI